MVKVTLHSFEGVDDAGGVRKIDWCLDVCESTASEKKDASEQRDWLVF